MPSTHTIKGLSQAWRQVMEHLQEVLLSSPEGLTDLQRESEEEAVQRLQRMQACCLAALTRLCALLLPAVPGARPMGQHEKAGDKEAGGQRGEGGAAANGASEGGLAAVWGVVGVATTMQSGVCILVLAC